MLEVTREFASRFWEFYKHPDIFKKWLLDYGWPNQDEFLGLPVNSINHQKKLDINYH